MKKILWIILLFLFGCKTKPENLNIYGNTSYTKQNSESLNTELNITYKFDIHEIKPKNLLFFIEGKVVTDYDHFNSDIKQNVFTTFGIEF